MNENIMPYGATNKYNKWPNFIIDVDLTTLGNRGSIPGPFMQDFTYNVILEHVSLQEPRLSPRNYLYTTKFRVYLSQAGTRHPRSEGHPAPTIKTLKMLLI
jgi:hypothetical protein